MLPAPALGVATINPNTDCGGAVSSTLTVNVLVVPVPVIVVGLNEPWTPAGSPRSARLTLPFEPLWRNNDTLYCSVPPWAI